MPPCKSCGQIHWPYQPCAAPPTQELTDGKEVAELCRWGSLKALADLVQTAAAKDSAMRRLDDALRSLH